jgi:hypothetical protein
MEKKTKNMNTEDIKVFIKNQALRCAGSCNSQSTLEFNILNELYYDLFGEPAVNTIPPYNFSSPTKK